jgi:hypothetical protein
MKPSYFKHLTVSQLVEKSLALMEPDGSFLCAEVPAVAAEYEPDE